MPYEVIESELTHKGLISDVRVDTITLPDGKRASRETVVRGSAAAVLPVDDNGDLILIKQYRHSIKGFAIEIPAGMTDASDESPLMCAARELKEETGYTANKIEFLFKMHSAIGFSNEVVYVYEATGLTAGETDFDEGEFIETYKVTSDEAVRMISTGEITDSKTIAAVLAHRVKLIVS